MKLIRLPAKKTLKNLLKNDKNKIYLQVFNISLRAKNNLNKAEGGPELA